MFGTIWHTFFFDPVYNGLIFFIDILPGGDVGLAIICTTVVVKLILLPLSVRAAKTQVAMREINDPGACNIAKRESTAYALDSLPAEVVSTRASA